MFNPQFIQQQVGSLLLARFIHGEEFENRHHILFYSKLSKCRGFLGQVADTLARSQIHGVICDLFIIKEDLALIRLYHSNGHIESGGFAGTVGSQQADDTAVFNVQAYRIYNPPFIIRFDQIFEHQCRHG